jgi:hypothetical protein
MHVIMHVPQTHYACLFIQNVNAVFMYTVREAMTTTATDSRQHVTSTAATKIYGA